MLTSGAVSGCTSIPGCLFSPPLVFKSNFNGSPSAGLSIGDQPAILPATTPAIAAAGLNIEFERDRVRFLDRDSGVAGSGGLPSVLSPPTGVPGTEFSRDLEPLRDRGRNSSGCCNLCARFFSRPPRSCLKNVSWSRISSRAGFHSNRGRSSSDTTSSGRFLRQWNDGTSLRMNSSGISRIITATGSDIKPRMRQTAHCPPLRRATEKACPPTKMIKI